MNDYGYPYTRLRRNRMKKFSRDLVRENHLSVNDLIYPIFVTYGTNKKEPVNSMPGIYRYSLDNFEKELKKIVELKIPAIAIFPNIENSKKNEMGSESINPNNLICKSIEVAKNVSPDLGVICDVALDPFTNHGHDGVIYKGEIENDMTVNILVDQALVQVKAGCDIIAPSDMMDGRVKLIRKKLEESNFKNTQIMSYTAKYCSFLYGPFRSAIGTSDLVGDKKTYQMDFANSEEAVKEAELDIKEGADMLMVKPGLPYLDIVSKLKSKFHIPIFSYQVSGEYSMLMNAIKNKWIDENSVIEILTCFKRAGCTGILSYFSILAAKILKKENIR